MKSLFMDLLGAVGISGAIALPFIEKLTVIGQFIGVCLGIILAVLSIIHKRNDIIHKKKEIERLNRLEKEHGKSS